MRTRLAEPFQRWPLAAAGIAGIVFVYHRWWHVNTTTVALTLLLYVLVLAARWPLRYAVASAVAATACYNFFFLPPLYTFTINDPQNWVALFALLSAAMIASRLSERARRETTEAKAAQRELEILFRLSSELLQTESVASLLVSAPKLVASSTAAAGAALRLCDGEEVYLAGDPGDVAPIHDSVPPNQPLRGDQLLIEVRSGVRTKGLLLLRGATLLPATADAIGKLVAVSLDRAQALETAAREEAARESERLRTLMIDSVTHELRTPLTSIKGAATALIQTGEGSEAVRELLSIIDEESDRLNRLVSEAVEVARMDAHEVQLHPERVRVAHLVNAALASSAWVEGQHPVELELDNALWVRADAHMLNRVLINLIENAAKYSPAGSPVTLTAHARQGRVLIEVADRGAGINTHEQELIFERFYRGESAKAGAPGTGMGLAVSRAIVLAHGGSLTVSRRQGGGSLFCVTLPPDNQALR